jgi:hypothetical protein
LHNKKEHDFEHKDMSHIYILELAFFFYVGSYGGDFAEKYGSRYLDIQVFACLFFSWPLERYKSHKHA